MDFSIHTYNEFIDHLNVTDYKFQTFANFYEKPLTKSIILRHDVDDQKFQSLAFAQIQHEMGIRGTYYFRMIPKSFDEGVVREIASMGHEIGYHYEDMVTANGKPDLAIGLFERNLERLRKVAEVITICMHGSPLSKYDNRELWKYYNYRDYGIVAEPYCDLDFTRVLYLTDTGRRWNGDRVSIRDRVPEIGRNNVQKSEEKVSKDPKDVYNNSIQQNNMPEGEYDNSYLPLSYRYSLKSTHDIINAIKKNELPNQIMFNFHPQRWSNNPVLWTRELIFQNLKNLLKAFVRKNYYRKSS